MFAMNLLVWAAIAAPQLDLNDVRDTSFPGTGVIANLSADGNRLLQVAGAHIAELDLGALRGAELNGGSPVLSWLDLLGSDHAVEASVMKILDRGNDYIVAGGDQGLFRVDPSTSVVTAIDTTGGGRWCFDVEQTADGQFLLAVWGGKGVSYLRVYHSTTFAVVRTIGLGTQDAGLDDSSISFALELYSQAPGFSQQDAFVAMGTSGVVRVDWHSTTPVVDDWDGANPASTCGGSDDACRQVNRVRDIAVAGKFLYAAAERKGLVEIDLTKWGSASYSPPAATINSGCGNGKSYALRVDAVIDSQDHAVIAVLSSTTAGLILESLNFYRYGGFTWDLGRPVDGDASSYPAGCANAFNAVHVFDRPLSSGTLPSNPAQEQAIVDVIGDMHHATEQSAQTVTLQFVDGVFWIYNNEPQVWHFKRVAGVLGSLTPSDPAVYCPPTAEYSDVALSLGDDNLVLSATDGAGEGAHHRIDPTGPSISAIPGTGASDMDPNGPNFRLGILLDAQWQEPASTWEWVVAGGWNVARFRTSLSQPNLFMSTWGRWRIPFPGDPEFPNQIGRHYTSFAPDYRLPDGWLALGRSKVPRGLALYWREDLAAEVLGDPGPVLQLEPEFQVDLHDYISAALPWDKDVHGQTISFRMKSFEWQNNMGANRAAIAHCVGANVYDHDPRIVFVDLSDCAIPGGTCGAQYDPSLNTALRPLRVEPLELSHPNALAFAVDVADVEGVQYAFIADTSGRLTAVDLTQLFRFGLPANAGPVEAGSWRISPSVLDGQYDILTDVHVRSEPDAGSGPDRVFVYAAANRAGWVKLEVTALPPVAPGPFGPGYTPLDFHLVDQVNTPGQATGMVFRTVGTETRLIVADHGDCGIKLYGDY